MSNKPIEIVVEDIFDKALELAKAYPDFKYAGETDRYGNNCRYSRGGCDVYPQLTGCIVGQAIVQAAGIDKCDVVHAWFKQLDEDSPLGITQLIHSVIIGDDDCPFKFVAKRYADGRHSVYTLRRAITGLVNMQGVQDQGRLWEDAAAEVKAYADEDCGGSVRYLANEIIENLDPVRA